MALSSFDERNLLLPLFEGIHENPLWDTFLRRLLTRTRARRICLLLHIAGAQPLQRLVAARGDQADWSLDMDALSATGLLPYASLRPERVYSLEEFIILDNTAAAKRQHEVLNCADIAQARFVRIVTRDHDNAWLILMHDRDEFSATDISLLSAVVPYVALAVATLATATHQRLRMAMAEEALALIGVGQAAFDQDGCVIAADATCADVLSLHLNGCPQLRARDMQELKVACAAMAGPSDRVQQVVRIDGHGVKDMLLRPVPSVSDGLPGRAAAIGLVRQPCRNNETRAAQVIASTLCLSAREGALAEAMSQGCTIVEAGAQIQLTPQTARNYSKRIYAKTGTKGQPALVRLLLTGLSPFCR